MCSWVGCSQRKFANRHAAMKINQFGNCQLLVDHAYAFPLLLSCWTLQRKPSYICNVNSQQNEALPYSIRTAVWRRPAVRRRELQARRLDPRKYRTPTAMPSGTHGTGQARLRSAMQYQHRPKTGLRHIRAFHKDRCDRPPADPRPPRAGSIAQYSRYPDLPGPVIRAGADDQYA